MARRPISVGLAVVLVGCTSSKAEGPEGIPDCTAAAGSTTVTIEADEPVALADQALHIQISGLDPGQAVTVVAQATDWQGEIWQSYATFVAGGGGVVDLDRDAPDAGTYAGVDGMGLFWSMDPSIGDPDEAWFAATWPEAARAFDVELAVCVAGDEVARTTLSRQWMADGVSHTPLRSARSALSGVFGDLYLPADGTPQRSAVLLVGGSGAVPATSTPPRCWRPAAIRRWPWPTSALRDCRPSSGTSRSNTSPMRPSSWPPAPMATSRRSPCSATPAAASQCCSWRSTTQGWCTGWSSTPEAAGWWGVSRPAETPGLSMANRYPWGTSPLTRWPARSWRLPAGMTRRSGRPTATRS